MEEKTDIVSGTKARHILSVLIRAIGTIIIYIGASAFILLSCIADADGEAFYSLLKLIIASVALIALGVLVRRIGKHVKEKLPWMQK